MFTCRTLRHAAFTSALLASFFAAQNAFAQTQSLFGNRGPAGQIGSNLSGSPAGGGSTMMGVQQGMGIGMGFGMGMGMGNLGMTGQTPGAGQIGFGGFATPEAGAMAPGSAGTAQGFIGRADNAGRFIGDQRTGQQTAARAGAPAMQTAPRFAGQPQFGTGGQFGQTQFGQMQFGQNRGTGRAARLPMRPQGRIGFSYSERTAPAVEASLGTRFGQLASRRAELANVQATMDDNGTAVLRGRVDSEEARRLAEAMARLEPGVRAVQNELAVGAGDE